MSTPRPEPGDPRATLRQPRWVLHIDMDAFFASCEQLTRPTLRGRPVLVGGSGGRGVVAGASYEARAYGARSAQPVGQARRAIGYKAIVLPPRFAVYRAASHKVFSLLRQYFPVLEQISIDEAFGEPPELAGATVATVWEFAEELRAKVREQTGLAASVGAGAGKQYAKIASGLAKPDGIYVLPEAEHATLLYPLPVRSLWGIGPKAAEKLALYGVRTVGELAAMRDVDVVAALGATVGPAIAEIARGHDPRPVHEPDVAKQISSEFTLAEDLRSPAEISAALRRCAATAHRRLQSDGRVARTVTVKLKLFDFTILSRSATLPVGTADMEQIVDVAERIAPNPRDVGAVRLVGVSLSGLTDLVQPTLFDSAGEDVSKQGIDDMDADTHNDTSTNVVTLARRVPNSGLPGEWAAGDDVEHADFGHGWVQGAGHGKVTVRFETRATGPGRTRTFVTDDPDLRWADPLHSLAWEDTDPPPDASGGTK